MDKFICENILKSKYTVYGSFYNIKLNAQSILPCRNLLEIYEKDYFKNTIKNIKPYRNKPDCIFVMMNPGSSKPQNSFYKEPEFSIDNMIENVIKNELVLAKPDITQYQVMRVMNIKGWKHVKVINLSDIREAKSNVFIKNIIEFKKTYNSNIHSIFSWKRKEELQEILNLEKKAAFVLAWGTNNKLIDLATMSLKCLTNENIKGLKYKNSDNLYFHPSPTLQVNKEKWLIDILNIL